MRIDPAFHLCICLSIDPPPIISAGGYFLFSYLESHISVFRISSLRTILIIIIFFVADFNKVMDNLILNLRVKHGGKKLVSLLSICYVPFVAKCTFSVHMTTCIRHLSFSCFIIHVHVFTYFSLMPTICCDQQSLEWCHQRHQNRWSACYLRMMLNRAKIQPNTNQRNEMVISYSYILISLLNFSDANLKVIYDWD